MAVLLFLLLLLPLPVCAAEVQCLTASGRVTGVNTDPAKPIAPAPGYTVVLCAGASCGVDAPAATIPDALTLPIPVAGVGWTTCATGRPEWMSVSGTSLVNNPALTVTAGGPTLFRCQHVADRKGLLTVARDEIKALMPGVEESAQDTIANLIVAIFRQCPTAGLNPNCDTSRSVATTIAPAGTTTILSEVTAAMTAKGY